MTKNTPLSKDWLALGIATGISSSILKSATNYGLHRASVPTISFGGMAADAILGHKTRWRSALFFQPQNPTLKRPADRVLGYSADALLGGIFGAALSYILAKSPPGNEFFKGSAAGAILWFITIELGSNLKIQKVQKANAKQLFTILAMNALFGGLEGMVMGKQGTRLIQQSHPVLVKNVTDEEFEKGRLKKERAGT